MRLRPVRPPVIRAHDFLETFEEFPIAHWAPIGPVKKGEREKEMNNECGSTRAWRRRREDERITRTCIE